MLPNPGCFVGWPSLGSFRLNVFASLLPWAPASAADPGAASRGNFPPAVGASGSKPWMLALPSDDVVALGWVWVTVRLDIGAGSPGRVSLIAGTRPLILRTLFGLSAGGIGPSVILPFNLSLSFTASFSASSRETSASLTGILVLFT